ncbi:MAG TPA: serine/threonine-protein kinase [Polyangium sp.]|nr:serine/threonine-protein kinase [Polyangium sp.]
MELKPGSRVNRYELKRRLGKGGQGSVWEVSDVLEEGAPRALKLIALRELEKGAAERAWREAQALQGVTHPGLVPCRELFRNSVEDLIGLVFDLVQGQSLAAAARDPRMRSEYRIAVLDQLAAVLAHVHALGIVHRDLKPDNVLVTDAFWSAPFTPGGVKLVDFGISAPAGNPSPITTFGAVVGTTPYLPPELIASGPWSPDREGFARDMFAFGVLGWELLFGSHPTGLPAEAVQPAYYDAYRAAWEQRLPWPPPAPESPWVPILRACLALDPQRRPPNGGALHEMLRTGSASLPGITQAHSAPTAAHVPPTSAQTPMFFTEGMHAPPSAPPPVARTASMPHERSPSVPHFPPPPSRSAPSGFGGASWPLLLLALVGAASSGAFALWMYMKGKPADDAQAAIPIDVSAKSKGAAALRPNVTAPAVDPGLPCCEGGGTCRSGHPCNPGRCEDKALPERIWTLRMTGTVVVDGNQDLAQTNPSALVCMRNERTGDRACSPMKEMVRVGGDKVNVLRASTMDLAYGRIFIRVVEGKRDLYPEVRIADNRGGIKNSILCSSMRLRAGPRDSAPVHVLVYLD